jgi:hypothetical protein
MRLSGSPLALKNAHERTGPIVELSETALIGYRCKGCATATNTTLQ